MNWLEAGLTGNGSRPLGDFAANKASYASQLFGVSISSDSHPRHTYEERDIMAPSVNHGALSREADLRTMAYVTRFIDSNKGIYLDFEAQQPILTQLAKKYDLRPYWKGYQNDQYIASSLHDKIISFLKTRKEAQWKTEECKGDASVDKLFEIGSAMLEEKVRDELAAVIHSLPATPPPPPPKDQLTEHGVEEAEVAPLPVSADDSDYGSRQPTKPSARSASRRKGRQPSKPNSSRRNMKSLRTARTTRAPNLSNRQDAVSEDEDGSEEHESEVDAGSDAEAEHADGDLAEGEYLQHADGSILSVSKKRGPGADFGEPPRSKKKANSGRGDAPAGAVATKNAGRRSMQKEADLESELDDLDEDDILALQAQSDEYNKSISEQENGMANEEPERNIDDIEDQHSDLPQDTLATNGHGIGTRNTDNALISTASRQTLESQAHASLTADMLKLDVRGAMLKVDECLTQALHEAFPDGGVVKVASMAIEPTQSLTRLYVNTLGQGWLKLCSDAANDDHTKIHFSAMALLKSLIWHYLVSEVLTKEVLSDTVYTVLRKVRAHLEPVLDDYAVPYSSVIRRASQAQFRDSGVIEEDVTHCAHDLKAKLMMILLPHLDEMNKSEPQDWRKDLSKSLLELCRLAVLLRARLEMEENKHEVFLFHYPDKFYGMQMESDSTRDGVVLFTKMPGIKEVMGEGETEKVILEAVVVRYSGEHHN